MRPLEASSSSTGHQASGLDEILLRVFTTDILRVHLVVEGEILAVFLFDALHFLVSICLFPPVVESCCYPQDGQNHKDHHCNEACKLEDSEDTYRTLFDYQEIDKMVGFDSGVFSLA